ncbi:MAG: 3'-5' exonuclease [Rhodobacteraceae bacterium]|nr:3'-5' exonuclease [Paracoccaceae bacterium]
MQRLGLRVRVLLFFCLICAGGIAALLLALWLGYRQLGDSAALSALITVAIVAGLGLLGICTFVWRLFDENVSKPIERLAAQFRLRTDAARPAQLNAGIGQYLGDLVPAAERFQHQLVDMEAAAATAVARETAALERQRAQLLRILSDIPVAVIVASQDHQIVLYDGQAADLMECEAPARLNGSVFDYLEPAAIHDALDRLAREGGTRCAITVQGRSAATYSGHLRLFGAAQGYTLMLEPLDPDAARPLVYDFDLLERPRGENPEQTALRDLTFMVFDSETTGLNPETDAVVQLGAVRVVNGRIVPGEVFETLVDPGRPIPAAATRVHGIGDDMVRGAPDMAHACAALHAFARGATIVAHNAPFDMAFVHRETGVSFDNPVLDTVHLSAVVFGGSADHTLDAICDRLSIEIPEALRHTALGDAMATAQALVAMLPVLEARGLTTFGALREACLRHSRILKVQT